jgi:hypothetical protein
VNLRCRSCGKEMSVQEYVDSLDEELEEAIGRVRADRV